MKHPSKLMPSITSGVVCGASFAAAGLSLVQAVTLGIFVGAVLGYFIYKRG